jgi:predicted transcriptional regulator
VSQRWQRNLAGSVEKIREGIQAVTVSPTESALQAKDRYISGVQAAVADGRYEAGLRSVSLQQWQEAALTKGVSRIATGAQAAQTKVQRFMDAWLPAQAELSRKISQMPKGTIADSQARAAAAIATNAAYRGKFSGR